MKKLEEIADFGPLPSAAQLAYHRDELAAFIHFGINTFYEQEWGNGQEDPKRFNPTKLDTDQWIRVLKETGFKRVIVVVKHHDGFVLYPSRYTDYTVAASPWRDGKGDLLAEISRSASHYDMDLGLYLSPWDAHSPLYHVDTQEAYNEYYQQQLEEILSNPLYGNKGKFIEIWMDGARGEGAQKLSYEFDAWFETIRRYQKDAVIFSTEATELRWIGNESGRAGDHLWQKIRPEKLSEQTPLLLNVPPTKEGLLAEVDIQRLQEFHQVISGLYDEDLAMEAKVTSSSERAGYPASNLTDGKRDSFWAPNAEETSYVLEIDLGRSCTFNLLEIREPIAKGQRIAGFILEVKKEDGWAVFARGHTIGYKRLLLGEMVEARYLRLILTNFQALPLLSKLAVYRTPAIMEEEKRPSGLVLSQAVDTVIGGQSSQISLRRLDGLEQAEQIRLVTEPGTGTHGTAYEDQIWDVSFAPGETRKELTLSTLAFTGQQELNFYLCASREDGRQSRLKIEVKGS
ncbi:alpha-L-fucosidase [Streptococcus sp. 27098_8_73]|uniref:alpha-L-fucosidase n=1 Tax=Streptococcus sp. 27098_8_73 TaxID=3003668 RepID=UPI00352E404D